MSDLVGYFWNKWTDMRASSNGHNHATTFAECMRLWLVLNPIVAVNGGLIVFADGTTVNNHSKGLTDEYAKHALGFYE